MLGGLVSPETVCTCISCVLDISLNYPLLVVLYTWDVEFSPNSLVPDIGPSAGQSLEWDSRPVSEEVNSPFSLCWELTFLSNLCYFAGWPLAVLCQLELITWSQACRSARPLKSSSECTRLSSVCQVFLKALVKLHTLLFVLCTDVVFLMARGLRIGKKQQQLFICNEGWIGETEISGLGQGTSSEEIKCFGSWYLHGSYPSWDMWFQCGSSRANVLLLEDDLVACIQKWLFQAPTCEASSCYKVSLDHKGFALLWAQWHPAPEV